MKKFLKILFILVGILALVYIVGPKAKYESVDNKVFQLNLHLDHLDEYVVKRESLTPDIKPDNQSRITWYDSIQTTEYAVVYLHGFEASWAESDPIVRNFAKRYGCNLYEARISQQGRTDIDALLHESPKGMVNSAKEAIAIGRLLGRKLIVISCSTGSTYSTYLAANDPSIYAQIMTSPNFDLADPNSKLLTKPWGKQILRKIIGEDYREFTPPPGAKPYWNNRYRIEGLIALRALIDQTMTEEIWRLNKTPIFIGYYYKGENEKDNIISVEAIQRFSELISTSKQQIRIVPISEGYGHVISSKYMNDKWEATQNEIFDFAEEVLHLEPVKENLSISY